MAECLKGAAAPASGGGPAASAPASGGGAAEAQAPCGGGACGGRPARLVEGRLGYALALLALYLAVWAAPLAVLAASGKSFIWVADYLSQQYVWFVYTGRWLREVAANVFAGGAFEVPLWTMDSGFGTDTVQALVCTVANPFYAVSAFIPEEYAEVAFEASMLACLYCAGLAFSLWAAARGAERRFALVGAVVYMFSGYSLAIFTQPGFLFPLLTFPLALWAADRVFAGRSPLPFVAVLAWVFAFSFYDAYMMCVMLVLYCALVFFCVLERGRGRRGRAGRFLRWFGAFAGLVLLACAVSCVLFLPQAMSLAGSGRLELERSNALVYGLSFYANFLIGFTSYSMSCLDAYTGFNAVALPVLFLLVSRRREHPALLTAACVLFAMLFLPFCGRVMNAMEYPTNRWDWALALCMAYAVARLAPALLAMRRREAVWVGALTALYALACLVLPLPLRVPLECAVVVAAVALGLVCRRGLLGRAACPLLALLACVSASAGFVCYLAPGQGDRVAVNVDAGKALAYHTDYGASSLVEAAREAGAYDETYRVDRTSAQGTTIYNSNLVGGYMAPNFYNSIYNDGIDRLWQSLGLADVEGTNNHYGALNSRSMLEALAGARYFWVGEGEASLLPYLYRDGEVVVSDGAHRLYETGHVAPLAFLQTSYITEDEYMALDMVDRQKALLQAVVLDGDDAAQAEAHGLEDAAGSLGLNHAEVPFAVASAQGCEVSEGEVVVREAGATVTLEFSGPADAETYLHLVGVHYTTDVPDGGDAEAGGRGLLGRLRALVTGSEGDSQSYGQFVVLSQDGVWADSVLCIESGHPLYSGKHEWLCNLGYSEEGLTRVTVQFRAAGTYTFETAELLAQPMEGVAEAADALAAAGAGDVAVSTNEISCTVDGPSDALLFLSVAYSQGWTAEVDGEEVGVVRADMGFMAVPVPAGEHSVVLRYRTPYLVEGAALTALGVAGTAAALLVRRRRLAAGNCE